MGLMMGPAATREVAVMVHHQVAVQLGLEVLMEVMVTQVQDKLDKVEKEVVWTYLRTH